MILKDYIWIAVMLIILAVGLYLTQSQQSIVYSAVCYLLIVLINGSLCGCMSSYTISKRTLITQAVISTIILSTMTVLSFEQGDGDRMFLILAMTIFTYILLHLKFRQKELKRIKKGENENEN